MYVLNVSMAFMVQIYKKLIIAEQHHIDVFCIQSHANWSSIAELQADF